jgi:hypothetical protein
MKKFLIAVAGIAAVAVPMAGATSAMADNGHTGTTLELTTTWQGYTFVHDYALTSVGSPSQHAFTGVSTADSPAGISETVNGTIQGQTITIHGLYPWGYTWNYSGPLSGGTATDSYGDQNVHAVFTTSR